MTQFDDPGGTGAAQVVIPSLHHDRAPVIRIGAHVASFHARRKMTETGFGHVTLDAHVAAPGPKGRAGDPMHRAGNPLGPRRQS